MKTKKKTISYYVITGRGVCGPYTYTEARHIRDYGLAKECRGSATEINLLASESALTERQRAISHKPRI